MFVTIKDAPSGRVAEKLRMAVGLILVDDNKVNVLFTDDGVWAGMGVDKEQSDFEIDKHLETLSAMGARMMASAVSAGRRGVTYDRFGIDLLSDEEISDILTRAGTTII